ncbi:hypothetical protein FAI41_07705 [Acetobacteraceae bacterium]|nr:hypothetical protein FAI41_07705 [Acetobacteraceae bacterium]
MKISSFSVLAVIFFLSPSLVFADICEGVAITQFKDEGGNIVHKGDPIERFHGDTFDKKGNPITYAQHGGYVWPADKVKLLNCHVEKTSKNGKIEADIVLDDTPENQKEIKYQKAEAFLEDETGLCNAQSSNAARAYAYEPESKVGRMTMIFINGRLKDKNFPEPDWPEGTMYGDND